MRIHYSKLHNMTHSVSRMFSLLTKEGTFIFLLFVLLLRCYVYTSKNWIYIPWQEFAPNHKYGCNRHSNSNLTSRYTAREIHNRISSHIVQVKC